MKSVKIGTRGSKLALWQANTLKIKLEEKFTDILFEIEVIKTKGDKILDVALSKIGDKGLFTKDIEDRLLDREIDIAVHSLKDLPTTLPVGLSIGAILERGEFRDALVSIDGRKFADLTPNDGIATSSLRRKAQILKHNPKFKITDIRGNVDTRLNKMHDGHCTAMVMAATGLQRLGYENQITEILPCELMIPAASQGAVAVEIRENDDMIRELTSAVNHIPTQVAVNAERIFLHSLQGGCQVPIGCYTYVESDVFQITGFVSQTDGAFSITQTQTGKLENANILARELAQNMIKKGASDILKQIREKNKRI